jgi:hypothetical protein
MMFVPCSTASCAAIVRLIFRHGVEPERRHGRGQARNGTRRAMLGGFIVYLERWPTTLWVARRLLAERAAKMVAQSGPQESRAEPMQSGVAYRGHDVERSGQRRS